MKAAVPEPQDHAGGRMQSIQCHMPSRKAHPSCATDDCSQGLSTTTHGHTRVQPGSWPQLHIGTHYHSEHFHSHAHTVTQAHGHRHELAYRDTQRLPILLLLGPERDSGGHGVHPPASGHDHFTWSRQKWLLTSQSLPSEHLTARHAPCLHTQAHTRSYPQGLSCKYRSRHST